MTDNSILESGMRFGPYPESDFLHIEKSACYRRIEKGVQIAEFLLIRRKRDRLVVWTVEAKSSSPRPQTQPACDGFIEEIRTKLTNAVMLGLAMCLGRHPKSAVELPESFKELDLGRADFRLILVIRGHQDAWLPPLQEALALALRPLVKTWAISPTAVVVLNESGAREHGLIIDQTMDSPA